MATPLQNLEARRAAICEELAAIDQTKFGGLPNTAGGGATVDHVGYKDGLYRELEQINNQISQIEGGWEIISEADT